MKTFLTFILITGFCFAEEPVKPLPKDVQTIVDAREKALQEARLGKTPLLSKGIQYEIFFPSYDLVSFSLGR